MSQGELWDDERDQQWGEGRPQGGCPVQELAAASKGFHISLSYSSNCDEGGDNHTELDDGGALVKPVHCSGGEGAGGPMGDDTKQDSLKCIKHRLVMKGILSRCYFLISFSFSQPSSCQVQHNPKRKTVGFKVPLNLDLGADAKKIQREEQNKIDEAEELTEEKQKEKEELLREGFSNWTKRGFSMFINANENMGERTWRLLVNTW